MLNITIKTTLFVVLTITGILPCYAQTVIDKKGTVLSVDTSKWRPSGTNIINKNTGNVGIGNNAPLYKLDVTGKIRATDSLIANSARINNLISGSISDSVLVVDPATGIFKRVNSARLNRPDSTTTSNGLNLNGKDVRLGGSLTQATTITTNNTNTLALAGLQGGNINTDSIMVITNAGVIKRISYQGFDFPQLQVDADRTANYSMGSSYSTIVYNNASTNVSNQWNTSSGIFTASSTGLYQIIVNNIYGASSTNNNEIRNRIILNGSTIHLEGATSFAPYSGSGGLNTSLVMSTVIQLAAGDNIRIQAGGEVGSISIRFGTGQHNIKIIRLK